MILCDREIRQLCLKPTHRDKAMGLYAVGAGHCYQLASGREMPADFAQELLPISDRVEGLVQLTKNYSQYCGAIEPFVPHQVSAIPDIDKIRVGRTAPDSNLVIRDDEGYGVEDIATLRNTIEASSGGGGPHRFYRAVLDELEEKMKDPPMKKIISYGLSSYGYDLRLGHEFKIFTNTNSTRVDPKNFDTKSFVDHTGDTCIVPPNSFVLAASLERISMPRNVTGVILGKSTYARCGISCLATPLEAGWEGHVTLEFANTTPLPAILYAGEGCCQVLFFRGNVCETSYADRAGKYMNQAAGPIVPIV